MRKGQDEVRQDYEELRTKFRGTSTEEFKSGEWFQKLAKSILENYSNTVDAAYIKRKYPGVHPANQARKAIALAAKHNAIAGGWAASAITALELSSIGPQAALTIPAAVTTVFVDITYCTRTQLRSAYDLSVIHGAPLSLDDIEDCYFIFFTALGIKLIELAGDIGVKLGPKIVAYNVRKLLRTGLRRGLQEILKRIGGTRLAKSLTERATMRLLLPGINIPIASGLNYYFTKQLLNVANKQMKIRGAVIQPVTRLHKLNPLIDQNFTLKILIIIGSAGDPEGWSEGQMNALRICQGALSLRDEDLALLEGYFNKNLEEILKELPHFKKNEAEAILDLAVVQASLADDDRHDHSYAENIAKLARHLKTDLSANKVVSKIQKKRNDLL
jgi:hypothetical protein